MELDAIVLVASLVGGVLTTVSGLGGGLVLIAVLSLFLQPQQVIAVTSPALFVGGLSRAWVLRFDIDRNILRRLLAGAVPAVTVAAVTLSHFHPSTARICLGVFLLVFVALNLRPKALSWSAPMWSWPLVGVLYGGAAAIVGGGGAVSVPFLRGQGLRRTAVVGTSAASGTVVNAFKTGVFFATGLLMVSELQISALAAIGIWVGTVLGRRILLRIGEAIFEAFMLIVLTLVAISMLL